MWDADEDELEGSSSQPEDSERAKPPVILDWRKELKDRLGDHSARRKHGRRRLPRLKDEAKPAKSAASAPVSSQGTSAAKAAPVAAGRELPEVPIPATPPAPRREFPEEPFVPVAPSDEDRIRIGDTPGDRFVVPPTRRPGSERPPLSNPVRPMENRLSPSASKASALDATLHRESAPATTENLRPRPLPLSAVAGAGASSQRLLDLEPPASPRPSVLDLREKPAAPTPPKVEKVSREILVSRCLCGLIDITLAAALAVGFVIAASTVIEFDFFSPFSLLGTGLLALGLLVFNSLFFLPLCGQTPGMAATGLGLQAEDGDKPRVSAVVLRSFLFLPSLASVVGLAWAILDPDRRCAHDVLSRTVVVDAEE